MRKKKKLLQNQLKISKWCTCRTWFWCAVFHYFSIWLCMSFLHDQVYFSLLMLQWLFLALFILLLLFFSRVQLFVTPWTAVCHASLSFTSPRVCSNSCPLSWWCYLTISPSATLFSFYLQSFPASGSFPMSWLFPSGSQSIRASASASVLPVNIQGWFPLRLTGLISLQSKGFSRVFSSTTIWMHQFFGAQPALWYNSHICTWLLEKP